MRTVLAFILFFFTSNLLAQIDKAIPEAPTPPRLYNDFTRSGDFLTSHQAEELEHKLVAYDDSTSNQIVIVILGGLNGYEVNEYATALGRKWGVGNKQFNNGVVVLITTGEDGEKRVAYIATGYGLEGAIPDITAKSIVDNELVPYLKEGKGSYYRGLDNTIDALIKAAAGEYSAPKGYANRKKGDGGPPAIIIFLLIVGIWILIYIIKKGGGGGMMSRRGYRGWTGPWIGTGGWSGGGGGGWSGGGGGGFGGFGGGSFGGGGAGSSW